MFPIDPRDFISQLEPGNTSTCQADNLVGTDAPAIGSLFRWSLGTPFFRSCVVSIFIFPNMSPKINSTETSSHFILEIWHIRRLTHRALVLSPPSQIMQTNYFMKRFGKPASTGVISLVSFPEFFLLPFLRLIAQPVSRCYRTRSDSNLYTRHHNTLQFSTEYLRFWTQYIQTGQCRGWHERRVTSWLPIRCLFETPYISLHLFLDIPIIIVISHKMYILAYYSLALWMNSCLDWQ